MNGKMINKIITSDLLEEDPDLIDLIDKFMLRLPVMYESIVKAYREEDWGSFLGLIHQMKGVGGGYGYPMLTTLCAAIEVTAKNENFTKLEIQLEEFMVIKDNILAGKDENHRIAEHS